jgi:hypothetical protein
MADQIAELEAALAPFAKAWEAGVEMFGQDQDCQDPEGDRDAVGPLWQVETGTFGPDWESYREAARILRKRQP